MEFTSLVLLSCIQPLILFDLPLLLPDNVHVLNVIMFFGEKNSFMLDPDSFK
jgi:hypothetical protein